MADYGKWQTLNKCNINIIVSYNSVASMYEVEFFKDGIAGTKLNWKFLSGKEFLKTKIDKGYMYTIDGEYTIDNKHFTAELDIILNANSMVLIRINPTKDLIGEDGSNIEFSNITDESQIFD